MSRPILRGFPTKYLDKMLKDENAINKKKQALIDIERQSLEMKYKKLTRLITPMPVMSGTAPRLSRDIENK